MADLITKEKNIKDMIFEIRGKQVLLDSDLALLYKCKNGTKDINKAVKRNLERFPEDFYFKLTEEEYKNILRFQNGTLELKQGQYAKYLPHAFTEQGVAMLSSVLRTEKASEVSVNIMRAFVQMRKFINNNKDIFKRVISIENDIKYLTDEQINSNNRIDELFNKLETKEYFKEKLFFDGEIYEAYSLLIDIIKEANKSIIIIDNYIDKTIFDILKYKDDNIKVEIWTKHIKSTLDIEKYKKQYNNINIKIVNNYHDRFIIIDNNTLYHIGASLKDLGTKCFGINKMDKSNIQILISKSEIYKTQNK